MIELLFKQVSCRLKAIPVQGEISGFAGSLLVDFDGIIRLRPTAMEKYYRVIRDKGIRKKECGASSHVCRHAYAQDRYEEITGFKAPCKFDSKASVFAYR